MHSLENENGNDRPDVREQLDRYYRRRLALLEEDSATASDGLGSIAQQLRNIERSTALKLRDQNQIHDEVLRTLERELDLLDARFAGSED